MEAAYEETYPLLYTSFLPLVLLVVKCVVLLYLDDNEGQAKIPIPCERECLKYHGIANFLHQKYACANNEFTMCL
jgi:hypothetical protein